MNPILQTCVNIEMRVAGIYRELVNHPEATDELREIWTEMAEDEVRHAKRIRLVADRLEVAGIGGASMSAEEVQRLLDRANEIYDQVQNCELSLTEAVYASVELEDEFLKAHLNYADAGNQPDIQTLFKFLAEEDRQHTLKLRQFLDRMHDGEGLVFKEP